MAQIPFDRIKGKFYYLSRMGEPIVKGVITSVKASSLHPVEKKSCVRLISRLQLTFIMQLLNVID